MIAEATISTSVINQNIADQSRYFFYSFTKAFMELINNFLKTMTMLIKKYHKKQGQYILSTTPVKII